MENDKFAKQVYLSDDCCSLPWSYGKELELSRENPHAELEKQIRLHAAIVTLVEQSTKVYCTDQISKYI
jgi:hypothetical protein